MELELEEFLTLYTILFPDDRRKSFWDHKRLDWSKHLEKLRHEGRFATKYRMPEKAFNRLVQILGPTLQSDITKSGKRCSELIYPEIIVAAGLRYLASRSYNDIREVYGMSVVGFYYCRNRFFKAILKSKALRIGHPEAGHD